MNAVTIISAIVGFTVTFSARMLGIEGFALLATIVLGFVVHMIILHLFLNAHERIIARREWKRRFPGDTIE